MPENDDEFIKNIQEFFSKFGPKEFLTIYIQQILLEMYRVGVHSTGSTPLTDLAHQYFFTENGKVRKPSEIDSFDDKVEERYFKMASEIVASLGDSFLKDLPSSPEKLDQKGLEKLNRKLQAALKKHLGIRWGS